MGGRVAVAVVVGRAVALGRGVQVGKAVTEFGSNVTITAMVVEVAEAAEAAARDAPVFVERNVGVTEGGVVLPNSSDRPTNNTATKTPPTINAVFQLIRRGRACLPSNTIWRARPPGRGDEGIACP